MEIFSYVIIGICLYTPYTEGNVVCLRPTAPINGFVSPKKTAYFSKEKVHITCSTRQHRLFGANSWECDNGSWKASLSYCSKETDKFKLKNKEVEYGILLDRNGSSCLPISHIKSNSPLYMEIIGTHRIIIVEIKDKPTEYSRHHKLYQFTDYSRRHDYKDISNYHRCITGPGTFIHYCDFIEPVKNPLILIQPGDEDSGCISCQICEIIFYENGEFPIEESTTETSPVYSKARKLDKFPTEESTTEIPKEDSNMVPNISFILVGVSAGIFLILSLFVVIRLLRRKNRKTKSEIRRDAASQLAKEHHYDYVNDCQYNTEHHRMDRPLYEHSPAYLNELIEFSNSRLREESGYLVPVKNCQNQDIPHSRKIVPSADMNIYCSISDMSLGNPEINCSNR